MTTGPDPAHPTDADAPDGGPGPPHHSPTGSSTLAPVTERDPEVSGDSPAVSDRIALSLPPGSRVLVTSDLHLRQAATAGSVQIEHDLVDRLSTWTGPGVVVLNGDVVELWGEPEGTVVGALDAHPALTTALAEFAAGPGRQVIVVVGDHDSPMAWDGVSARALARRLGARTTLSVDLEFDTPAGRRMVRCEHGHAFDPANALSDPRNPLDSPLGQHVVQQVLPAVTRTPLMADLGALADPSATGRFVASRLVYRQLGGRAWWLLVPLLMALLLRLPLVVRLTSRSDQFSHAQRWLLITGLGLLAEAALLSVLVILVARTVYSSMGTSRLGPRGAHSNGAPRTAATALCSGGLAGLITAHTHQPELAAIPGGFYANSGCGLRHVESRSGRFGLPPVFAPVLRRSWVEIDVVHDLRVRLLLAETPTGEATRLERLAVRRQATLPGTPQVVATLPGEAGWPLPQDRLEQPAQRQRISKDRRHSHQRSRCAGTGLGAHSAVAVPVAAAARGSAGPAAADGRGKPRLRQRCPAAAGPRSAPRKQHGLDCDTRTSGDHGRSAPGQGDRRRGDPGHASGGGVVGSASKSLRGPPRQPAAATGRCPRGGCRAARDRDVVRAGDRDRAARCPRRHRPRRVHHSRSLGRRTQPAAAARLAAHPASPAPRAHTRGAPGRPGARTTAGRRTRR